MGLAYQGGKHVHEEAVGYQEVTAMRVEFLEKDDEGEQLRGRWRRVCIDGLIVRVEEGGWMEVSLVPGGEERGIDVVVPREIVV